MKNNNLKNLFRFSVSSLIITFDHRCFIQKLLILILAFLYFLTFTSHPTCIIRKVMIGLILFVPLGISRAKHTSRIYRCSQRIIDLMDGKSEPIRYTTILIIVFIRKTARFRIWSNTNTFGIRC